MLPRVRPPRQRMTSRGIGRVPERRRRSDGQSRSHSFAVGHETPGPVHGPLGPMPARKALRSTIATRLGPATRCPLQRARPHESTLIERADGRPSPSTPFQRFGIDGDARQPVNRSATRLRDHGCKITVNVHERSWHRAAGHCTRCSIVRGSRKSPSTQRAMVAEQRPEECRRRRAARFATWKTAPLQRPAKTTWHLNSGNCHASRVGMHECHIRKQGTEATWRQAKCD